MKNKLKMIQDVELEGIKEIKRVCEENNLTYFLAFGTMLGAVRHSGFVPWDDDTDVYMPLKDLKCFEEHVNTDIFFLQTEKSNPQMPFVFYKLRKNGTKMIQDRFRELNIHHGIWVDIFPYVNASRFMLIRKFQYFLLKLLQAIRMISANRIIERKKNYRFFISKMPNQLVSILDKCVFKLIPFLGSKSSKLYLVFDNDLFDKVFVEKKLFDNLINYTFEDAEFKGIKDYNVYLTNIYGKEYMTPKRYCHLFDYSDVIIN